MFKTITTSKTCYIKAIKDNIDQIAYIALEADLLHITQNISETGYVFHYKIVYKEKNYRTITHKLKNLAHKNKECNYILYSKPYTLDKFNLNFFSYIDNSQKNCYLVFAVLP